MSTMEGIAPVGPRTVTPHGSLATDTLTLGKVDGPAHRGGHGRSRARLLFASAPRSLGCPVQLTPGRPCVQAFDLPLTLSKQY